MNHNTIEVSPELRSIVFTIILLFGLCYAVKVKIPEKSINLTFGVLYAESAPVISAETIVNTKEKVIFFIVLIGLYSIVNNNNKKYTFTIQSIKHESGVFTKIYDCIQMIHVVDFEVTANIYQRLLGLSNLTIMAKDTTDEVLVLRDISETNAKYIMDFLGSNSVNSVVGEMVRRRQNQEE